MKRFHVHVAVDDLDRSVKFYAALFAAAPTVVKPDYAKWMLDDPRVNFAISARGRATAGIDHLGIDHLGIQVEDQAELGEVYARLKSADGPVHEQGKTTCCYAEGEKSWILDPQGVSWETFLTLGDSTVYGDSFSRTELASACCDQAAATAPAKACCGA